MTLRCECDLPVFAPHCNKYTNDKGCTSTEPCPHKISPKKWSIGIDEIDDLVCITTEPEKWMNKHLTIPLGHRDEEGNPIYKVVKPKPEFSKKKQKV